MQHAARSTAEALGRPAGGRAAAGRGTAPPGRPSPARHARYAAATPPRRPPPLRAPAPPPRPAPRRRPAPAPPAALPAALLHAALPAALLHAVTTSPGRDAAAFAFAAAGSRALVAAFQALTAAGALDRCLSRKLVHTLAGPLFVACWPLFGDAPYSRAAAAAVPLLSGARLVALGTGAVRRPAAVAAMSRTGDAAELLRGPLAYVAVLAAATLLGWRTSPVGIVACALMCGGDGLADIAGRRWGGRARLPWNADKSWAGSAAMLAGGAAAALAGVAAFAAAGYLPPPASWGATAARVAAVAAAATAVESLPLNRVVDDNLSVPGVAALLAAALLR